MTINQAIALSTPLLAAAIAWGTAYFVVRYLAAPEKPSSLARGAVGAVASDNAGKRLDITGRLPEVAYSVRIPIAQVRLANEAAADLAKARASIARVERELEQAGRSIEELIETGKRGND